VLERAARIEGDVDALAEVLVTPRRAAPPEPGVAAPAQHDCARHEGGALTGVEVERKRAETGAVGDEQPAHVPVLDDGDAPPINLLRECAQHGATRVVAGKARAPPPVRPEEALVDLAVVGTRERAAPLVQLG